MDLESNISVKLKGVNEASIRFIEYQLDAVNESLFLFSTSNFYLYFNNGISLTTSDFL